MTFIFILFSTLTPSQIKVKPQAVTAGVKARVQTVDIALNISTVIVVQDIHIYRDFVLLETDPVLNTVASLVKTDES